MMLLTYKYRLNPNARQHRALKAILEQQRQLYNAALQERIEAYRLAGKTISDVDQSRSLTIIRADDPAFASVQRRIQRGTLKRLERAYKAFFRRAKQGAGASSGFPKFKGFDYFDSFGFDAFAQIRFDGKRLHFAGMPGGLRVAMDRPLPQVANPETGEFVTRIKNVWFKAEDRCRGRINRWHVGFQVEVPCGPARTKGKTIGVDWGTSVLAALSTGETIANPRFGEKSAKAVRRASRKVARARKGSRGRAMARRAKRAIERKTANRRRNCLDKFSKRLATHYAVIATEAIDVKGLMNAERIGAEIPQFIKTRRNREVLDTAPFLLRQMTGYKARLYGAQQVTIDPTAPAWDGKAAQPTQRCSMCGGLHFKELTEDHVCSAPGAFFGARLPRKVNAARVIAQLATHDSPLWGDNGGGPVPGDAEIAGGSPSARPANGGTGRRRPGKTVSEQSPTGRRPHHAGGVPSAGGLSPHTHDHPLRPPPRWPRMAPS